MGIPCIWENEIEELFGILFPLAEGRENLALIYTATIDDSADRNREKVIISGAMIGDQQRWKYLAKKFKERLDKDGIEYFKSSHCRSLNGQFHKYRQVENGKAIAEQVERDLDTIIRKASVMSIGLVLSVPFYHQMAADPQTFGKVPSVPYELAFQQILAECAKAMKLMGRNNIVTFAHDDGKDYDNLRKIYKAFKKKNPHLAKYMMDFIPLSDKTSYPIQAADVSADVTHKYAEAWIEAPSADNLKRLRESMYKIVVWHSEKAPELSEEVRAARCEYVTREDCED